MEKRTYERPTITKLNAGLMNKFGSRTESRPMTHIDNVAVSDLVDKYGSPVFVLSEQRIRSQYRQVQQAFATRYPKVQMAWSYKTNYLDAVCRVYHQEGSWAEVVSGFEYRKALRNGVPGEHIIFNGPDKSIEDLQMAIDNKSYIHIDHLDELYTLIALSKDCKEPVSVAIRVNMDTGVYPQWDRFGFNYENLQAWDAISKIMVAESLNLVGLHCHIGTYMMTPHAYTVAASKLAHLAAEVAKRYNHRIQYIDMGGGFPSTATLKGTYLPAKDQIPPIDDFAEAITSALISSELAPDHLPWLFLETGRALIDEAGYLIASVLANKRLANGRRATIMDAGVNVLFTSFWYNHTITPAQEFSHYAEDMELFGPLCMNIDVIRESVNLPLLHKDQHVVIHPVGAYNMTQWMQFIAMRPNVVLIDMQGKPHLIREAETMEYLTQPEKIPDYLQHID